MLLLRRAFCVRDLLRSTVTPTVPDASVASFFHLIDCPIYCTSICSLVEVSDLHRSPDSDLCTKRVNRHKNLTGLMLQFSSVPFALIITLCQAIVTRGKPPNILFIMADDLGFSDLDWKDDTTRSAFMTGYYPFRVGTQMEPANLHHQA
ncbi:hypothetical protein NECAME_14302 [Necator americanus]|uniref:Sulfatase N-terminal domain-containing protein n=1 Tax=Necator americanus TaxID=51031 RepID=W2SP53_NECAM|nr:hypothetical protein NECAME_14302 [Necator americanus]ETN71278.1 hypothetical protein NECAME_14302 [Necator americanus]